MVAPLQSTTYILNMKDSCTVTTSKVTVSIEYCLSPVVTVPNIFTPNADAINDVWLLIIQNPLSILNYQCTIYDGWGIRVYTTNEALAGWMGIPPAA